MIYIPFKFTAAVSFEPLLAFLGSKYSTDEVARYGELVNEFTAMRNAVSAITQANEGAADALARYWATSEKAAEKFPISETVIKIGFTWTDTLRAGTRVTQYNWTYERASVLFNLGALESHLGTSANRDEPAGIDAAIKHYQAAATLFAHLRDSVAGQLIGTVPLDLSKDGLNLLVNLMLAQAQACVYEMARSRNSKPELCARLSGRVADLYRAAKSSVPEIAYTEMDKEFPWSAYLDFHATMYDAASFNQYALKVHADAATSGQGYGIEIGWMKVAELACNKAATIGSIKHKLAGQIPVMAAQTLRADVVARLEVAVRDNNSIYYQSVPAPTALPVIPRAEVAKLGIAPDYRGAAKDLFSSIVPAEVAASLGQIEERLGMLSAEAKERGAKAAEAARAALAALGLPGYLEASESSSAGLPSAVWERVRKTQISGGLPELERLFASNNASAEASRGVLGSVLDVLRKEETEDAEYRRMYADRWTATSWETVSAEVYGEQLKFQKVADVAAGSDKQVRDKLDANRPRLTILGKSRAELDATIPMGGGAPTPGSSTEVLRSQLKEAVAKLQACLDDRPRLAADIRTRYDRSGAISALTPVPVSDHGPIIDRLSAAVTPARTQFESNMTEQSRLVDLIKVQHTRYAEVRAGDERTRAREAAIQEVGVAVDKFEELYGNLRDGQQFYEELRRNADRLLQNARDLVEARGIQRRELLMSVRAEPDARGGAAAAPPPAAAAASAYPTWAGAPGPAPSRAPVPAPTPAAYNPFDQFAPAAPAAAGVPSWMSGAAPQPAAYGVPPGIGHAAPVPVPVPQAPSGWGAPPPSSSGGWGAPASYPGAHAAPPHQPQYAPAPVASPWAGAPPSSVPVAAPVAGISPQLRQLLEMGFPRADAENALRANGNDFDRALAALLH